MALMNLPRRLSPLLTALLLPLTVLSETTHNLYLMASLSQDFTIGQRVTSNSGLYLSEDRQTAIHLGFHHPRLDQGDYDPRDPKVLYMAALNGILGTRDGGKTWKILTSWNMTEGKDVKVDPFNPDRVLAALPDGIALSENQGETWRYADQGIRRKYTQTLAPDRSREGHLLAGTELGIFLSTDGSQSWERVLETTATVNHIVQSPHDPDHFLAATQENGAWLSRDGGLSWKQIHEGKTGTAFHHGQFHPHEPQILTLGGWGAGLLVSKDSGDSWTRVSGLASDHVWSHAMDPDYPNRVYACLYRDTVYVSDDLGESWNRFLFPGATIWAYLFVPES